MPSRFNRGSNSNDNPSGREVNSHDRGGFVSAYRSFTPGRPPASASTSARRAAAARNGRNRCAPARPSSCPPSTPGLSSRNATIELISGSWLDSRIARSSGRLRISSHASCGDASGTSDGASSRSRPCSPEPPPPPPPSPAPAGKGSTESRWAAQSAVRARFNTRRSLSRPSEVKRALGIRPPRLGIFRNAVAKKVNLHRLPR